MQTVFFNSFSGFHLIAYIRCWQNTLNEAAEQNELKAFKFNTYILSVLVIFFLQITKKIPKLKDLPATQSTTINHIESVNETHLKEAICQFFEFYGEKYSISRQLISINIGRWQERHLQHQQINLKPEQKRLI